jgi:hypothetical protein
MTSLTANFLRAPLAAKCRSPHASLIRRTTQGGEPMKRRVHPRRIDAEIVSDPVGAPDLAVSVAFLGLALLSVLLAALLSKAL